MTPVPRVPGERSAMLPPVTPEQVRKCLQDARAVLDAAVAGPETAARIAAVIDRLAACFKAGGKVLICGNGGSACDAAHFAEELTGRFRADRPALPAIACVEPGHLTCVANDYGFEQVFSRWVEALGKPGDVLILLSTSGNSPNIARTAAAARERGLATVALLGKDGGRLRGSCDLELIVPGATSDRIQELHMLILHVLVEGVESLLGFAPRQAP
jgi:D-sedoheptulose 7-phosphate isomerase